MSTHVRIMLNDLLDHLYDAKYSDYYVRQEAKEIVAVAVASLNPEFIEFNKSHDTENCETCLLERELESDEDE